MRAWKYVPKTILLVSLFFSVYLPSEIPSDELFEENNDNKLKKKIRSEASNFSDLIKFEPSDLKYPTYL